MRLSFTFLLICLCIFSYGGKIQFFDGSPEAAFQKAEKENKLVFVDFYASWCKPCKQMDKRELRNKKLTAYLNENYINLKVDVDSENPFFQKLMKGKLQAIPYLAFFSSTQEQLAAIEGYTEASTIYDYADKVRKEYLALKTINNNLDIKAETIALDLCVKLEDFTNLALQLNETEEGTEAFNKLYVKFEKEMEIAALIIQELDGKMGDYLNSQYFIDQFGKSLERNCLDTYIVMQFLVE